MAITKGEQFEVNFSEDIKRVLAANLTAKGQSSVGTETLTALVKKVANVETGVKVVRGQATIGANTNTAITGLPFDPNFVVYSLVTPGTNASSLIAVVSATKELYQTSTTTLYNRLIADGNSTGFATSSNSGLLSDGFTLYVPTNSFQSKTYNYWAFKL